MNYPMRPSPWRRHGLRASAAVLLLACGFNAPLHAANQASGQQVPAPTARAIRADMPAPDIAHRQAERLTPAQRAPQRASKDHFYVDYDRPEQITPSRQTRASRLAMASAAAAPCDVNAFAAASGSVLVSLVRSAAVDGCINTLFGLSGSQAGSVFNETKMVTIANALRSNAASYTGNNATGTLQLILFLRAGYYAQYSAPADVGSYGAALRNAIRPALDTFVANVHFKDVNDAHGAVLTEFVTLIDSSGENAHQMNTIKGLLDRYNNSYHAYWYMMSAANNVFTVLFRGHYNADFVALVQSDASITTSLASFISRNAAEADTGNAYLLANAGRELARFLQYASIRPAVKPQVLGVLDSYSMTGHDAAIWVATADVADYHDHADCGYFDICDFRVRLAAAVLPISYQCSPDLHLRAQSLTPAQVTDSCNKVMNEEAYFHQRLNDNHTPVADDHNTMLELVIFRDADNYQTYSGVIFGNDTNNGGMYLEGDPSAPGNQPRFVAYVADWLPTFEVWNLTHEYVHYLDGRFDMYGDFSAAMSQPTIWWVEGVAEYISYSYRGIPYPEAIVDAGTLRYPLSAILANDYNSGQERIYRWGYLATRYMFEKQPGQVGSILGYFRPGNYAGYGTYLAAIRTTHDADWNTWLTCLNTHVGDTTTCGGTTTPPTDPNPPTHLPECTDAMQLKDGCQRGGVQASRAGDTAWFYIYVPAGSSRLTVATAGGTGNADLYVSGRHWPTPNDFDARSTTEGNAEQLSLVPAAAGGYYYVAVYARTPYAGVTVSASVDPGSTTPPPATLPECTGAASVLASGCQRSDISATRANDSAYFTIWVPQGKTRLSIQTRGGSGNADLYVRAGAWPTTSSYDRRSISADNRETVDITSPRGGAYYYVNVVARTPFSGVVVGAQLSP